MNYVNIKIHTYSTRVENKFYSQTYTDMKETELFSSWMNRAKLFILFQ